MFGMSVISAYSDGVILTPEIISMTPESIIAKFQKHAMNLTGLALEIGHPTKQSVPHMVMNAFKNIAAIAVETGYDLAALKTMSAAAPKGGAEQKKPDAKEQKKPEAKKEAPKEEPKKEEEEDVDMGNLFGF